MIELTPRGRQIRRDTIALAQAHGGYHFGGSFSVVEILLAWFESRGPDDILVFSKGHGCWPLYVLLREQGLNPLLEGHPYRDPSNGIEYTTGSLGHGLPAALGMALARKIQQRPGRITVILGEGDLQEGTFWESLLLAGHHQLANLTAIVDLNGIQGSDRVHKILPVHSAAEFAAHGALWSVRNVPGHDIEQVKKGLSDPPADKPLLIMAHTIKGRGVSFMEDAPKWHACGLSAAETAAALAELA